QRLEVAADRSLRRRRHSHRYRRRRVRADHRERARAAAMTRLVVLALVLLAAPADADDEPDTPTPIRFGERGAQLTVTTKPSALFDRAAYEALKSGFPSTIVITSLVYEQGSVKPIDDRTEIWTVFYDLWDENYVIRLGEHAKPIKVKYQSE